MIVHAAGCKKETYVRMTDVSKSVDAAVDQVSKEYIAKWGRHMNTTHLVNVPCKELKDILKDAGHRQVDFMSVDVQGSELHVLETVDPATLSLVLVEAEGTSLPKNQRVREFMQKNGLLQLPLSKVQGPG